MFPLVKGGVNTPPAKLACGASATPLLFPFRPRRHLLTAERYRAEMQMRFAHWADVSCVLMAA